MLVVTQLIVCLLALTTEARRHVSLNCGYTMTLSKINPTKGFFNVHPNQRGSKSKYASKYNEVCSFTVKAPEGLLVEVDCPNDNVTANGREARNFTGPGPVLIEFTPTERRPQMTCRAKLGTVGSSNCIFST